jgi:hypothetical protein
MNSVSNRNGQQSGGNETPTGDSDENHEFCPAVRCRIGCEREITIQPETEHYSDGICGQHGNRIVHYGIRDEDSTDEFPNAYANGSYDCADYEESSVLSIRHSHWNRSRRDIGAGPGKREDF